MDPTFALLSILGTTAVGTISPGPSFVLVVRASAALSRRDGLASALGMGCGGLVFALLALAGLQALLMQVSWLYLVLKVAGGAYLFYLGFRIWRGAEDAAGDVERWAARRQWLAQELRHRARHPAQQSRRRRSGTPACSPPSCRRTRPTWMFWSVPPLIFTHRVRLVHHRRLRLLRIEAARDLSRRQAVDRPLRRRRGHAAWRQADPGSGARPVA